MTHNGRFKRRIQRNGQCVTTKGWPRRRWQIQRIIHIVNIIFSRLKHIGSINVSHACTYDIGHTCISAHSQCTNSTGLHCHNGIIKPDQWRRLKKETHCTKRRYSVITTDLQRQLFENADFAVILGPTFKAQPGSQNLRR